MRKQLDALERKWREQAGASELNALKADSIGLHYCARISDKRSLTFTECAALTAACARRWGMAEKLIRFVTVDDGAVMSMMNPLSFADGGLSWTLRWGSPEQAKAVGVRAATVLDDYDYLLNGAITTKEAIRRLRILRAAWRDAP